MIPADRGTWSGFDDRGLVGVSAVTGEYRFLDLPRFASNLRPSWALSPDGRYVAYLYQDADQERGSDATGLALYDVETGTVIREIRAPLGSAATGAVYDPSASRFAKVVSTAAGPRITIGTLANDPDDAEPLSAGAGVPRPR